MSMVEMAHFEVSDEESGLRRIKSPSQKITKVKQQEVQGKNRKLMGLKSLERSNLGRSQSMCQSADREIKRKEQEMKNSLRRSSRRGKSDNKQADRMNTCEEGDSSCHEPEDMRRVFIDQYGVMLDFAGFYYHLSKFVPNQKDLVLTLCWHITPECNQKMVQTTKYDRTHHEKPYEQVYAQAGKDILFKVMRPLKTNVFQTVKQIQLKGVIHCLIEFSKDGSLLGIYDEKCKTMSIYNSSDIVQCLDLIQQNKHIFKLKINFDDREENIERIIFDQRDKYLALISKTQVRIVNINKRENQSVYTYTIPEQYDRILDIILDSKDAGSEKYKALIACGWEQGRKIIGIFDINDDSNPEKVRQILCTKWGKKLMCKISDDGEQVVFSNGLEHYILKGRSQDFFPHIGEKTIRDCINHNNQFYFVSSNDQYDRDISIQNSNNKFEKAKIQRSLEPGQIRVFDSKIYHEAADHSRNCELRILMYQGDYLFLDTIDLSMIHAKKNKFESHISTCIDKYYMAYGFNWPYFSYASQNNCVFILNAFNPNFIQRYELPGSVIRVGQTFLTDTHDLYALCEIEGGYEVYNIDLDSPDPYLEGPLLKYQNDQVENQPLLNFHVRASSRKEKINLNKALIFFMMHGSKFYGWCETDGHTVTPVNSFCDDPDPLAYCSNYYYLSDESLFYMISKEIKIGKRCILHSEIKFVQCQFGSYKVSSIYQDKDNRAEILNFGVDNTNNRLLILSGVKNSREKRDKFITLFSFNRDKIIFSMKIHSPEIIGRLKSNLYNFVGGHIYYNNQLIKIRYDILDFQHASLDLKEEQVFDHYVDVLFIDEDDEVQSGTPLQTCLYNRIAYVIRNQTKLKPRQVIVLPYLHERKVYLNRRHTSNQFYNLMKHQNGINYITCLCISENKMYIYTETGILIDRVDYNHLAETYGKPVCISENGSILIFRKGIEHPEIHLIMIHLNQLEFVRSINIKEQIDNYFKENIDEQNDEQLFELKQMLAKGTSHLNWFTGDDKNKQIKDKVNFYQYYLKKLQSLKDIKIDFILNDDAEVLVRLRPKKAIRKPKPSPKSQVVSMESSSHNFENEQSEAEDDEEEVTDEFMQRSFFYFFPNPHIEKNRAACKYCYSCSKEGQVVENEKHPMDDTPDDLEPREFIYFDSTSDEVYDLQGISMNQDFIFFWNTGKVWKLHTTTQILSEVGIYVDEDERESYIIRVRCSSNKSRVCIRVKQSSTLDCMIIWDLWKDVEIASFDVQNDAVFLQDRIGNVYMAENDYIINCEKECKVKSYKVQVQDFEIPQYNFSVGYRVDERLHNYMLMRNYVNLSFSYMTFIIKRNFDNGGFLKQDVIFDQEGFDYILKRNTIFTEGTLITQDYDKLKYILSSFYKIDKILLEQLFYRNDQGNSPLHIAVSVNNTRVVNLILQFLALIDNAGINVIKNIFKELINYKDFSLYLLNAPFQSHQMEAKQTLMIPPIDDETEEIILVSPSSTSYVDVAYFEDVMGEDKQNSDYKTYTCKIYCVRADWILNDADGIGMEFMQTMLKKKNRDIFMTPYIQVIIKFLYEMYSRRIKTVLLPAYIAHLIFVNIQLFVNEHKRDILGEMEHSEKSEQLIVRYNKANNISNVVVCLCGVINLLNMLVFIMQTRQMRMEVFYRLWSYIDMTIIVANFMTVINLFVNIDTKYIRLIECILILFQWFKCLYYMRLIAEIAPLIESIFVIMNDMFYFCLIFLIGIFAFSEAFFVIGKNQAMLKERDLDGDEGHDPPPSYSNIFGALSYSYMAALTQLDPSEFDGSPMTPVLYALFILLSFIMCIHLLNMLIAIMGQSFDRNSEIADSNRKISQLEFVINNWWIHPIKNKQEIVYFVAAFAPKEDDENEGKLEQIDNSVKDMRSLILNLQKQMGEMQYQMSQMQAVTTK